MLFIFDFFDNPDLHGLLLVGMARTGQGAPRLYMDA